MCLGAICRLSRVWDDGGIPMASIEEGRDPVCLLYLPEARPGDDVVVHQGFALEVLDPDAAAEARELRSGL